MLHVEKKLFPISLKAMRRSEVELEITIENKGEKLLWVDIDVSTPPEISLSNLKDLHNGRLEYGIIKPGKIKVKHLKFFSGAKTAKYEYSIPMLIMAFDEDAVIAERIEDKLTLRAEDD